MDMAQMDTGMGEELPQEGGGFTICLNVGADGAMTVGVEPMEGEKEGEPVEGLEAAITKVIQIVKNGGQMPDMSGEQAQFDAGYEPDAMTGAEKRFG